MTVIVIAQHLDDNSPEGFNNARWVEALRAEYVGVVRQYLPGVAVDVRIDRQRNTGGAIRPVDVFTDNDTSLPPNLTLAVEETSNRLFDARGDEFYGD